MIRRTRIAIALVLSAVVPLALSAQTPQSKPTIPDSPAGRVLNAWLEAFNSTDSAKMTAYLRKFEPDKSLEPQLVFRNGTGGFDLVSIENAKPQLIEFVVKEHKSPTTGFGVLEMDAGGSGTAHVFVAAIPPAATAADYRIDGATRARVVEGAIARLDEAYVFPDVAKKMGDAVRARLKRGEYDDVNNGLTFANRLTEHFQVVSHDKHLRVNFSPLSIPSNPPPPSPEMTARQRRQIESMNCGFVKVELLPGNVGYVKFNQFAPVEFCGPTATAAMNFVANADALIFDLRDNGGGAPAMVTYISSYLFSKRTHLNDLWTRRTNSTEEFWTDTAVSGKKLGDDKSVYVLTSKRTFSGGEEFTNNLKEIKRATIVGETTGGGAHPVGGQRIDDHFIIGVPFARAINPITKTNWEGTGVEPDVKVPAADALTTAQKLIVDKRNPRP